MHTKDYTWKIKMSTNSLLNTRYPDLIQDRTDCLLCSSATESNAHFWSCPTLLPLIRTSFVSLASKLEDILKDYSDQLTWSIKDSIVFYHFLLGFYVLPPIATTSLLWMLKCFSSLTFPVHYIASFKCIV